MIAYEVLRILADGNFYSGEVLGQHLQMSRAAIWKHIKALQAAGINIHSVHGKGYCWSDAAQLLSADAITAALPHSARRHFADIDVVASVDSTNKLAMAAALDGKRAGFTRFAEHQTAGRGRRGRDWSSPPAQNLYFSSIYRSDGGAAALQGLSLVVGISLAETLNRSCGLSVQVKWPNDLVVEDTKLGGILIEMVGDSMGACAAIIGIGINVNMRRADAKAITQAWTSIAALTDSTHDRNQLAAALLAGLANDLSGFERGGLALFIERWQCLDYLYGKPVKLLLGEHVELGTAQGIDADGALSLDTSLGVKSVYAGEVSVRVAS